MFDSASRTAPEDRHEYPRTWVAALNFAHLRHKEKDDQTALAIMEKARADYPGIWDLISFQAELLRANRGPAAALPIVQEFSRAHWWHAGASIALGRLNSEIGNLAKAEEAFRHASRLDVHDAEALNLLALLSARQNKLADACKTQRRAVSRQPDQPRQYLLLSDILTQMGRAEEAQAALAHVSAMKATADASTALN
jgi:tetratricopeptide (TPR) repeat protein